MKRRDHGPHDDHHAGLTGWMPVLAALPVFLLGIASAAMLLRQEATRPVVGDLIVFRPGMQDREMWRVVVPAVRIDAKGTAATACVLNSNVMAVDGGSLIIEQRNGGEDPRFRVHWAGPRTEQGAEDCGRSADLLVTRQDVRKLASAAGGFGVTRKSMVR